MAKDVKNAAQQGAQGLSIEIGISAEHRKQVADGLSRLLADTHTLYLTNSEKTAWMLRSLLE